jgi:hypothetical protein
MTEIYGVANFDAYAIILHTTNDNDSLQAIRRTIL